MSNKNIEPSNIERRIFMQEFFQTLLIACIPAVISGMATIAVSCSQYKSLKVQNKHDIERLIKQHEVDIDNLKEKHLLEMETKDKEHRHQLEFQQKEFENKMLLLQKEIDNAQTIEGLKGVFGMLNSTLQSPEGQKLLSESIRKSKGKK